MNYTLKMRGRIYQCPSFYAAYRIARAAMGGRLYSAYGCFDGRCWRSLYHAKFGGAEPDAIITKNEKETK